MTAPQRFCAGSVSLNGLASPAARDPGPLVTMGAVADDGKVDSIGLVERRCTQCSAVTVECEQHTGYQ